MERLFAAHRAALQSFFRQRIRSKSDAPDLAQAGYMRMLRISDQAAIRNPVRYLLPSVQIHMAQHRCGPPQHDPAVSPLEAWPTPALEPQWYGMLSANGRILENP